MPHTSNPQQAESTTYHGDAHGDKPFPADKWTRAVVDAAVRCHTMAINAGSTPTWPADDWLKARRCADEALALLIEAVQLAGKGLGVYVDMRGTAPDLTDMEPGTLMEIPAGVDQSGFSTRRLRADDTLLDLGYRWSAQNQQWIKPAAPPADPNAWPEGMAQDLLRTLGWAWTGAKWENRKPAPSVLDQPLGVPVVVGRGGGASATRFPPDTPVRALLEHADGLDAKVRRQQRTMSAADDAFTAMLNGCPVHKDAVQAARNALREF